ncbi:KAT8 regulatory NSL complex subunit 1 [Zerene cesonia]|uniref:KAT8 regulatory NSL complex subunit 1 n=1 Tax=Zerene cesonia TaxID=33412 RepID=UPI0018E55246|nr:KAT8 regulatory NSL complex subunit 1 [Zerene cesonia]XP_038213910.1 KAT8 regulatory NSL complex subunit 1 [Zerene cesonia]XP_038213911.1 KAT8 regulatory NSL complex subunit 1 [Zerene cesonia]XP_038213912.1 KAT8 regulatory NSL complex subunit 1 [Zerene cesonia]XP_038213913.1 KAT8 regulatory NSL complex subunit 1 [Zerene cesonia]
MAPALTVAPQATHYDVVDETEKLAHRRRALVSVNNLSTHMEDDDMGLQNQPSLAKDSQEMEQILVDLGSSDIVQADLLQAIKTLESGGDALSTGDPEAIFPLSGFDLTETADSEGDAAEDKIRLLQARLERRCAFLLRRLRILQARSLGKRIAEEATQTFERCTRGARKDGGGRPMGLKAFLKRIETTSALQASAASRTVVGPKYYNPGTSKGDVTRSASLGIPSGTLTGLEDTAGALRSHLSVVKHQLDSDATDSSSGAESNDEALSYNNQHQQHMPIEKRALWSWQRKRASIASRWCWLQAQVQELEYKIRQHNDLHKQVREAKGRIEFEGEPVGYEGSLPGDDDDLPCTCARVRPLRRDTFKKRKLLQMHNLHLATSKAAKPSDIKCSCQHPVESCAVCTGRAEPTQPAPPFCTLAPAQRRALVDPAYHPVLSDVQDIPASVHMSALTSRSWFRARFKSYRGAHHAATARPAPPSAEPRPAKRQPTRLKRGRPPLSRKVKERDRDDDTSTSGQERGRGRPSTESRGWRRQSYDIDNIVIPQSIAANTRPEILTYKEIITPKWRVMDIPPPKLNNGISNSSHTLVDESDEEDISEPAVEERHMRAETSERNRYLRKQRSRRVNTETEQSQQNTSQHVNHQSQQQNAHQHQHQQQPRSRSQVPQPQAHVQSQQAQPQAQSVHSNSSNDETERPYTPRKFPLPDDMYQDMLSMMPESYHQSSPEPSPPRIEEEIEESSSLSPMSPLVFEGDDPDDGEWNPSVEKTERRKSSFR